MGCSSSSWKGEGIPTVSGQESQKWPYVSKFNINIILSNYGHWDCTGIPVYLNWKDSLVIFRYLTIYCPSLDSITVPKTMKEKVISSYNLQSITMGSQGRSLRQEPGSRNQSRTHGGPLLRVHELSGSFLMAYSVHLFIQPRATFPGVALFTVG